MLHKSIFLKFGKWVNRRISSRPLQKKNEFNFIIHVRTESLTSNFAGHANDENTQADAPSIALNGSINTAHDSWDLIKIVLINWMNREDPEHPSWYQGIPKDLEPYRFVQLEMLIHQVIVNQSGQNTSEITAKVHIKRRIKSCKNIILYERVPLRSTQSKNVLKIFAVALICLNLLRSCYK